MYRWVYRFRQRFFSANMNSKLFSYAMLSHQGRVRKGNEDTCAAAPEGGVFVVCDGMGGAAAGEVASKLAAETFLAQLAPEGDPKKTPRTSTPDIRLDTAIHAANQAVYQHSRTFPELHGMGTTLVALLLEVAPGNPTGRPSLTLAHVGDSRCYLFRGGELRQLTQDHSLVEEQVRAGQITPYEAEIHPMRNIITRAVGSNAQVEPEIQHLEYESGDLYLLASDGLTRELKDRDIAAAMTRAVSKGNPVNLESLCQVLIAEANDAGGGDNITVLLLSLS
ncbi:protein serine/threonine phosphatase [Granulicella tundricola MP5ACTX9]|uniref:Protein serine/threonine phosphatase n=2 Tax=Granulicella TaxID=940557 RepID=E8X1Q3_GRATM|nr:protein serine/threonine phosphatase [Granulicella tundricola MP5ACTX9]